MPLAIPSSGESKPFIRFLASINSWQMSVEGGTAEFAFDKPAAFDIQNVQLGWLLLETGNRDWQPWPDNAQTRKPEGDYKAGFEVDVFSSQMFGGEPVRSLSSNATGSVMFIQELYAEAEKHPEFAQGLTPIVQLNGSKALKVGKGNTRVPQFQIVKWVARPAAFSGEDAAPQAPAPRAAAPAPKPAAPKAAPAAADNEF
jgi:hypothetical protein